MGGYLLVITCSLQVINCRGGGDCYGGEKIGVYDFFFGFGAVEGAFLSVLKSPKSPPIRCMILVITMLLRIIETSTSGVRPRPDAWSALRVVNVVPPSTIEPGSSSLANHRYGCNYSIHLLVRFAKDYARLLNGTDQIKREIWKRGPVSCGVDATKQMDE